MKMKLLLILHAASFIKRKLVWSEIITSSWYAGYQIHHSFRKYSKIYIYLYHFMFLLSWNRNGKKTKRLCMSRVYNRYRTPVVAFCVSPWPIYLTATHYSTEIALICSNLTLRLKSCCLGTAALAKVWLVQQSERIIRVCCLLLLHLSLQINNGWSKYM